MSGSVSWMDQLAPAQLPTIAPNALPVPSTTMQASAPVPYPMVAPHPAPDGSGAMTNIPDALYQDYVSGKPYVPPVASPSAPQTTPAPASSQPGVATRSAPKAAAGSGSTKPDTSWMNAMPAAQLPVSRFTGGKQAANTQQSASTSAPVADALVAKMDAQSTPGYGYGAYIGHNATLGADEPVAAAANATFDWAALGQPWGKAYDQELSDMQARRQAWVQQHPIGSIPAAFVGGLVTGGTGLAKEIPAGVEAASAIRAPLVAAGKSVFEPFFASGRSLPAIAHNIGAGAGLGAVSGFGLTDGGLRARLQGAENGALMGGAIGTAAPVIGAAARGVGNAGQWAYDAIAPLMSEGARESGVGQQLAKAVGDRPIQTAPLPGVNLTLDQATNDPRIAAAVDKWQARQPSAAMAMQTDNNAAIRDALSGVGGGQSASGASAQFTEGLRQAQAMADREENRLWNVPTLAQSKIDTTPVKQAVAKAITSLPPGLKLGLTGQLKATIGALQMFPKTASVSDINSIKSALFKIGSGFNPANAQEAGIARSLTGTIHDALDQQLTDPGADPAVRNAYEVARDFTRRSRAAFDTQRSLGAQKSETESTAARKFLSPNAGAPEGAENIDQIRQVLRSFRSDWERLQQAGAVDRHGIPYSHDDLRATEQSLKSNARSYIVARVMDSARLGKLDAEGNPFFSPNKLNALLKDNRSWMQTSGLFTRDQMSMLDAVAQSAEMLGRTQNLRAQVGSHTNARGAGTFFEQKVLGRVRWLMRAIGAVGGYHAGGLEGGAIGLLGENMFERVLEHAKEATQEIMDRALGDPKFAHDLMMQARPANAAMMSSRSRAALQRFEAAMIQATPSIRQALNGQTDMDTSNAPSGSR